MIISNGNLPKGFKPKRIVHVGRKCPKGYKEETGGIHLGKGTWLLNCVLVDREDGGK